MSKKIVFCGGGNMAEGVMRSLIQREVVKSENISVSELNTARCEYLKETYGVNAMVDAKEAMKEADMIIIAVLPKIVPVVARTIKEAAKAETVVLSIAAGVTIASMEEMLGADRKIVRVMPNTLGQSGNGHSAVCLNGNVNEEEKGFCPCRFWRHWGRPSSCRRTCLASLRHIAVPVRCGSTRWQTFSSMQAFMPASAVATPERWSLKTCWASP